MSAMSSTAQAQIGAAPPLRGQPRSVRLRDFTENGVMVFLVLCGLFTLLTTGTIIFVLGKETLEFFNMPGVSVTEFLFGLQWNPLLGSEHHFGIWPLVVGTLMIAAVAMIVALPLGLITAIWLSEYAPPSLRAVLKPILEILAGVPTVVFGFFALTVITPSLQWVGGKVGVGFSVYNATSAGIAVGILSLPIVTSLTEDALRAVPRALREASYGLGATKFETSIQVVVPAALSGIIAAFLLAVARAVGETMIVALAAGSVPLPLHEITNAPQEARNVYQADGRTDENGWKDFGTLAGGATEADFLLVLDGGTYTTDTFRLGENERFRAVILNVQETTGPVTVTLESMKGDVATPVASAELSAPGRGGPAAPEAGLPVGDYRVTLATAPGTRAAVEYLIAAAEGPKSLASRLAMPFNVTKETQPMTGYMVQIFLGDASNFGPEYLSSYAVAAALFVMTFILTVIGHIIRVRFQQVYE